MSMPIPLRDSDRTKAAILHAAQVAFSTRGYGATGVRDITAAVHDFFDYSEKDTRDGQV